MTNKSYNDLIRDLDKYKWVDRPDLSIYDGSKIEDAISFHKDILSKLYEFNLSDVEARRIERICNTRLVKLMLYSDRESIFTEEEKKTLRRVMQNAKLEDAETMEKFIRLYLDSGLVNEPLEIINEWERELKNDLKAIRNVSKPILLEFLTDTLERRAEAIRRCKQFYQSELVAQVERLKRGLENTLKIIQAEILKYKDTIRQLEKNELDVRDKLLEELKVLSKLGDGRISRNAMVLLSRVEKSEELSREVLTSSITLYCNLVSQLEEIYRRLEGLTDSLDRVKFVLNEVVRIADDELHYDITYILNPAVKYINAVSKLVSSAMEYTRRKIVPSEEIREVEKSLEEFEAMVKEVGLDGIPEG